jgi:superfamily II DNA helicase RecQ
MKCKTFKIHLQEETGNLAEVKLNKFLEDLNVTQVFASVVSDEYWSVLVFYDDNFSAVKAPVQKLENTTNNFEEISAPKASAAKFAKSEVASVEPIVLTTDEEKIYAALREWRNEQAARDGLPPYMIAHNDSLMTMAKIKPKSREELVQIKGFGEKRAEKYGEELLQIINQSQTDFS